MEGLPIYWVVHYGHLDIVKILAPLTNNPNAPTKEGITPIYWAAKKGYTEIMKILATLTQNFYSQNISFYNGRNGLRNRYRRY